MNRFSSTRPRAARTTTDRPRTSTPTASRRLARTDGAGQPVHRAGPRPPVPTAARGQSRARVAPCVELESAGGAAAFPPKQARSWYPVSFGRTPGSRPLQASQTPPRDACFAWQSEARSGATLLPAPSDEPLHNEASLLIVCAEMISVKTVLGTELSVMANDHQRIALRRAAGDDRAALGWRDWTAPACRPARC
jgi:hypothetical protein